MLGQLQQLKNYNNPRATTTGPEYHSCDTTLTTCQPLLPTCHAAAVLTLGQLHHFTLHNLCQGLSNLDIQKMADGVSPLSLAAWKPPPTPSVYPAFYYPAHFSKKDFATPVL